MPVNEVREMHGLRKFSVNRVYFLDLTDKPLTEAKKEHNRAVKRNAEVGDEYNDLQLKLCCLLDDKIFLAESLNFLKSTDTAEGILLSEMMKIVKTRLRDASLAYQNDTETLRMLNKFLMKRTFSRPKDYPEPDTPELFYRAFNGGCWSRHCQDLGFRSSNQPLTPPSYYDGTLLDSSLVDKDALKNHCEGNQPSDLIALIDSPSRVLRITRGWGSWIGGENTIAVISVSKLMRMGIPAECIKFYISVPFLRNACDIRGIDENDFDAKFLLEEILSLKVQNLSL
ncbi:hypothetical protein BJX66DRAFT_326257 [Aspergillus keveii]|uniref:Uncharacterized protein n=1 Tax=Aspergillus keveii TaxID=714993 RepID=A0ABR4G2G4_9EURO